MGKKEKIKEKIPLILFYIQDGVISHETNYLDIENEQALYGYMKLFVKYLEQRHLRDIWQLDD